MCCLLQIVPKRWASLGKSSGTHISHRPVQKSHLYVPTRPLANLSRNLELRCVNVRNQYTLSYESFLWEVSFSFFSKFAKVTCECPRHKQLKAFAPVQLFLCAGLLQNQIIFQPTTVTSLLSSTHHQPCSALSVTLSSSSSAMIGTPSVPTFYPTQHSFETSAVP